MTARRLAALLLAASLPPGAALAQPAPVGTSTGPASTAPHNPSAATAGLAAPGGEHTDRTDRTVQDINGKLLSQERDRPHLPGQAPSPSQGGTSMGARPDSRSNPRTTGATPPPPR